MLKIRMQRVGRKHEPVFRLVLTESQNSTKSGRFLEILGSYDSRRAEKAEFKSEKILQWIKNGAQLSPTVHNLLVSRGAITGKKVSVLPKKIIMEAKNKKLEAAKKVEEEKAEQARAKAEAEAKAAEPKVEEDKVEEQKTEEGAAEEAVAEEKTEEVAQ